MQVRISNVSKLVPRETLFALFSILGDVLCLDPVSSEGALEWNCVFANVSDAQRALELTRTELGDSIFYVEPNASLFLSQPTRTQGNPKCRTAVLHPRMSFSTFDLADADNFFKSFFMGVEVVQELGGAFLIEFSERPEMLRACGVKDERYDLQDASCCFKLPVVAKEPKLYGVPASKLLSVRTNYNAVPSTPFPTSTSAATGINATATNTLPSATPYNNRNRSPERRRRSRSPHRRRRSPSPDSRRRSRSRSPDSHRRHHHSSSRRYR